MPPADDPMWRRGVESPGLSGPTRRRPVGPAAIRCTHAPEVSSRRRTGRARPTQPIVPTTPSTTRTVPTSPGARIAPTGPARDGPPLSADPDAAVDATTATTTGPDGAARCPWATSAPDYLAYHDEEWGRPVRDDRGMFERLTLEAFQSGLSWLTILRKRPAFRRAFADFDIPTVAGFGAADERRLLADAGIVRNRAKVAAAIRNAQAALALPDGLAAFVWSFAPSDAGGRRGVPRTLADVPAQTTESKAMAKALKRNGFVFVGPTTCYALMQATGIVDDHLANCVVRQWMTAGRPGRRTPAGRGRSGRGE